MPSMISDIPANIMTVLKYENMIIIPSKQVRIDKIKSGSQPDIFAFCIVMLSDRVMTESINIYKPNKTVKIL